MMKLDSFGLSDIGLVRTNNEDAWAEVIKNRFFVLADGMGGHQAGEVASHLIVEKLTSAIKSIQNLPTSIQERAKLLQTLIEKASREIYLLSLQNAHYSGMGTTLACLWFDEKNTIIAHVGDSRIYRLRKAKLSQLTLDHSLRQELLVKGKLHERQASTYTLKNIITRAIGTQMRIEPSIEIEKFQSGDIYLICSDGLTDELSFEEIQVILSSSSDVKEGAHKLIKSAKENGGSDNITIVIVKIL